MAEYFYNQMLRRKCHQKKNPLQKFKKAFDKALFFLFSSRLILFPFCLYVTTN